MVTDQLWAESWRSGPESHSFKRKASKRQSRSSTRVSIRMRKTYMLQTCNAMKFGSEVLTIVSGRIGRSRGREVDGFILLRRRRILLLEQVTITSRTSHGLNVKVPKTLCLHSSTFMQPRTTYHTRTVYFFHIFSSHANVSDFFEKARINQSTDKPSILLPQPRDEHSCRGVFLAVSLI